MRVDKNEKFLRTINFLTAVNHPEIMARLTLRGFGQDDVDHGWQLVYCASGVSKGSPSPVTFNTFGEDIKLLNEWENIWFDVAGATLQFNFPAIHQEIFGDITKTSGQSVIINIKLFLERYDALKAQTTDEARQAIALLVKRGLTEEILGDARTLMERIQSAAIPADGEAVVDRYQQMEEALMVMWSWFQQWATIARTLDFSKRQRIRMGLSMLKRAKTVDSEDQDEEDSDPTNDPTPEE
ncbi:hypothetical protein KKF84_06925 [Myxococcota bacterium]|nr:hypothetical protein [Myxococcota bacterium]MBU1535034.1 hypothetical protein [Myxococcota bacterium]